MLTFSLFFYRLIVRRNANWIYITYPYSKSFVFCYSWDTLVLAYDGRNAIWTLLLFFFIATQLQHHLCLYTLRIVIGRIGCVILDIKACLLIVVYVVAYTVNFINIGVCFYNFWRVLVAAILLILEFLFQRFKNGAPLWLFCEESFTYIIEGIYEFAICRRARRILKWRREFWHEENF